MKKFVLLMILFVGGLAMSCTTHEKGTAPPPQDVGYVMAVDQQMNAPVLNVQDEVAAVPDVGGSETTTSLVDFLKTYAVELVIAFLAFLKVIVNLTPTTKDNQIFGIIDKIISWIVPNMKTGGGKFT